MAGTVIAQVKYRDGHSDFGEQTISVLLTAHSTNLTVVNANTRLPMFSIPWGNLKTARLSIKPKKGMADLGSSIASIIPGLDLTRAATSFYEGIKIIYWDEEFQRNLEIFFSTSTERQATRYKDEIYRYRDAFFRATGRSSRPDRR